MFCSELYVKRISKYYRRIRQLRDNGVQRVSSEELAKHMKLSPSQVRTDLGKFCLGQSGYGYNVVELARELEKLIGIDKIVKLILIGVGKVGQALLNYSSLHDTGFHFVAAFDINPIIKGKRIGYLKEPVKSIRELASFLETNPVDIAVLAIDQESIQSVTDILVRGGVKGIWNFAPCYPLVPEEVVLENVHIQESLLQLSYKLT